MKSIIICTFLICISFLGVAQNRIIIKGTVTDSSGIPISNTNISITSTLKGTTTNLDGIFYLKIKKLPSVIKVSHINYQLETIRVKKSTSIIINDTLIVSIILNKKINQLNTFEINSDKIELLYNKPFVSIYDYQFYEDNLLLLLKEKRTFKIKLMDSDLNVLKELPLAIDGTELYKDCFGNSHIMTKDSVYQVWIDSSGISLIYNCSLEKFNMYLSPCQTKHNKTYIFKQLIANSQTSMFYYLNENKDVKYLKRIRDELAERYVRKKEAIIKKLEQPNISKMSESKAAVYGARDLGRMLHYIDNLLINIAQNPLFAINNSIYIFDHPNDSCWVFDENLLFNRSFYIDYESKKGWDKELILDKLKGEVYAKFKKGSMCYLKKIDLQTGKTTESYKLEKHTFPTKIKINNNIAYYLYKDHYNHGQMSLFKQGLY